MCVKDCGLHNQNIDVIILFARLVDWLNSLPVYIQKKIKAQMLKYSFSRVKNGMPVRICMDKCHTPGI